MNSSLRGSRSRLQIASGMIIILIGFGLVTAACGVPLDKEPRVIARTSTTIEATPTTVSPDAGPPVRVYYLRKDALEPLEIHVEGEDTIEKALKFAIEGPPKGSSPDLRTAVPADTTLRSPVVVQDGTARIDLSEQFNDLVGKPQKQAFAQLVFTALEFQNVKRVRFKIAGENVEATTDNGNKNVVRASDYEGALNPR